MPFTPEEKNAGDLIKSLDWNAAMDEIVRLESDKVNKTGDALMTGPLTIEGNVGIGAATPNDPLSFGNTTGLKINLSDDGTGIYGFGVGTDELQIGTWDASKHISLGHYSGSSRSFVELMRVDGNGNVGIGTTNPQASLHVVGELLGAAKNTAGKAMKICTGSTEIGSTNWEKYGTSGSAITIAVNTSAGNFSKKPIYLTSLHGSSNHWRTTGASSVYSATKNSFKIYIRFSDDSPLTPAQANQWKWHIQWIAIGE